MIIDCILDRKDAEQSGEKCYSAREFYFSVFGYIGGCGGHYAEKITAAMDYGTEIDVKREIWKYIRECGYNESIIPWIFSHNWLVND